MKRIARNAAFLLVGDGVSRLIGFFSTVYLARVLGAAEFGIVTIGLSALAYAMWASDAGLSTIGARELAKPKLERSADLFDIVSVRIGLSLLSISLGFILVHVAYGHSAAAGAIYIFLLSAFSSAIGLDWYYQGRQNTAPIAWGRMIFSLTYLISLYVTVRRVSDVFLVPWCYFGATLLSSLAAYLWIEKQDRRWRVPSFGQFRSLIGSSITVGTGSLMAQIVMTLPPLAIGFFLGEREAGRYGVASKMMFLALAVDRLLGALFVPAVSRMYAMQDPLLRNRLRITVKYVLASGVCIGGFGTLYAEPLIKAIFGEPYKDSAILFAVAVWFVPVALLNTTYGFGLIAMNREKEFQKAMTAGGFSSGILVILLCVLYGAVGAAVGVVLGELSTVVFTYVHFRKLYKVNPLWCLLRPASVMVLLFGVTWILQLTLWWMPLLAMVFFALFAVTGGWRLSEWRLLTGKPA